MDGRKKPEILAPAGRFESLEAVIKAGADAVYLGGKQFNMRMWRSDFNFSREEIEEAIAFAHSCGARVYVTVNNLYWESELKELAEYLCFLEAAGADGLIVQDLAVAKVCRDLGIRCPLHASVQMNMHNREGLELLKSYGFSRAIVSKDLTLEQVRELNFPEGLELEYFVHGDLCAAHTGQCMASSFIFGESGNRGRCLKPCRWRYRAFVCREGGIREELSLPGRHLLACKDLCLYPYLPQLVDAGITAFKIEGRMREGSYLGPLVSCYRRALDRYWSDPAGYRMDLEEWAFLWERRIRDFTPGRAMGNPPEALFGYNGEREPYFPTRPIPHPFLSVAEVLRESKESSGKEKSGEGFLMAEKPEGQRPLLAVRVGTLDALREALRAGAEIIYAGGEVPLGSSHTWGAREIETAAVLTSDAGREFVLVGPAIAGRCEMEELRGLLSKVVQMPVKGVLAGNWGVVHLKKKVPKLEFYGDYRLNIVNAHAAKIAQEAGLQRVTASLELPFDELENFVRASSVAVEVVVHGSLTAMLLEHCLPFIWQGSSFLSTDEEGRKPVAWEIEDECGEIYRVEVDQHFRTHLLMPRSLCLLAYLPAIVSWGPVVVRLEMQYHTPEEVAAIVSIYRSCLDKISEGEGIAGIEKVDWKKRLALGSPRGYTLGAQGY